VPAASVDRVTQAQEDLDAAFADVDKSTPLVEAGQQVNAAAVSLEMAWLRVLVDAGCLSDDQQAQAVNAAGAYTTALQNALTAAGLYDGPVDGVYGPGTAAAVQQLQADSGLPATGFVDQATADALDAALQAAGVDATSQEIAHTAALQSLLAVGGYWTGPIDGKTSDALTAALKELQTDLGVPVTGVVDAPTIAATQAAIEELQNPTTTTTTTDSDESSSTTSTTAG
jgi:peptidoglycan hydrolase-like protein with peptidoglycan-binding domain